MNTMRGYPSILLCCLLNFSFMAVTTTLPTSGLQRRQTDSRKHCSTGTCHFYSMCMESRFPCGPESVMLSYAARRCEAIENLNIGDCPSCVNLTAYIWAHETEICFQNKLLARIAAYDNVKKNPVSCLSLEREALLDLNSCYSNSTMSKLSEAGIKSLVETFRVGGVYYESAVDQGIPRIIAETRAFGAQLISRPLDYRVMYCIKADYGSGSSEAKPGPEMIVSAVRGALLEHKLGDETTLPLSSFHYGGMDEMRDNTPCSTHQPADININSDTDDFHLVTLFINSTESFRELPSSSYVDLHVNLYLYAKLYELTTNDPSSDRPLRSETLCGDGVRQAAEECDFSGVDAEGCSMQCTVEVDYDCATARLQPSECFLEMCGDGLRTRGEECDDGNLFGGDGCDGNCNVQHSTYTCSDMYNATSICELISSEKLDSHREVAPARLHARSITSRHAPAPAIASKAVMSPSRRTADFAGGVVMNAGWRPVSTGWSMFLTIVLTLLIVALLADR